MVKPTIRVLLVEDHTIVRKGLCALLETEPDIHVVGEAENGLQAVELAQTCEPDVILMDLVMPEMDGVEATRKILENQPNSHVLVLTSFGSEDKLFPAIKAGALGYLLKDTAPAEVLKAIRHAAEGYSSITPTIARRLLREFSQKHAKVSPDESLTKREIEVLKLVALGHTNTQISRELFISPATTRTHVSNILAKLNLSNRTQAALYALRQGLITLSETE